MSQPQPTEAQELANAAHVYRKYVQDEMVDALSGHHITIDKAEWWFERFIAAYRREIEAERLAKSVQDDPIRYFDRITKAESRFRMSSSGTMTTIEIGDVDEATKP